jgi:hypothetical protein
MSAFGYYNFMEGSMGLGKNGTHAVHAGVAGGATWAVGQYGGVEMISGTWWAPFAGAFAGLGLSLTARMLLVNDEVSSQLVAASVERELKGKRINAATRAEIADLLVDIKALEAAAVDKAAKAAKKKAKTGDAKAASAASEAAAV